jgi:hypothetical protein
MNSEVRTHTRLLSPQEASGPWQTLSTYFDILSAVQSFGTASKIMPNNARELGDTSATDTSRWPGWTGLAVPSIRGLKTFQVSPFSPLIRLGDVVQDITNSDILGAAANLAGQVLGSPELMMSGGGNSSISVSPAGIGMSVGFNPFPSVLHATTTGSTGSIVKQASETGYSYQQVMRRSYDETETYSRTVEGTSTRIVERNVFAGKANDPRSKRRISGAEVAWQGEFYDVLTASLPVNLILPAIASRSYRNADESIRVRLTSGETAALRVDIWFDVIEEVVRDDY